MKTTAIVEKTTQKTITSLELSKLSGRRHWSILRSIESMNKDLIDMDKTQPVFCEKKASNNKIQTYYILTIYQCELLALALDWKARIKVLDKLEELREKPQQITIWKAINTLIAEIEKWRESWKLLQELYEVSQKQQQEIKELKANNNKYKALQTNISQLWQAEVLMSVEEAGVVLWKSRNRLFEIMRFKKFLKKDNSPYKFYKWKYFIQKEVKYRWKSNKLNKYMQTFILPKGLELLKQTFA